MANTAQLDVLLLGTQNADGTITRVTAAQTSQAINLKTYPLASICVDVDGGTISSGTLLIEQAWWDPLKGHQPYSGLWSLVQTLALSTLSGTAQQQLFNIGAIANTWTRVRLSVAIGGGGKAFVSLVAEGNS